MAREEKEINSASIVYASQLCFSCLDFELCKGMSLVCPEFRESVISFSEGIRWADEHPVKKENVIDENNHDNS